MPISVTCSPPGPMTKSLVVWKPLRVGSQLVMFWMLPLATRVPSGCRDIESCENNGS